jgi:IclR family acetate operon transcriptional repressor
MQLERLISILEMTAVAGRPISVANLQIATGLPRPTCYRMVQTLTNHRLLEAEAEEGRYVIGDRLIRLALLGKSDIDVRRATAGSIKEAAIHLGDATFLARLRNKQVEIIHVETPDDTTLPFIHPGLGNRPVHACSSAKAIAAFAEVELQNDIIGGVFEPFNANTHASRQALFDELKVIAECGYAECDEEIQVGISSVAAPVRFGEIGVTFSVGSVGHASKYTIPTRQKLGKYLGGLSKKVEAAIQLCNVASI